MMMKRRHQQNAATFSVLALRVFEVRNLQYYGRVLYHEDSAQHRQQQFFTKNNSQRRDDSTKCKRTRVTHENLRRISVVPQEADACTNKRRDKNYKLSRQRD